MSQRTLRAATVAAIAAGGVMLAQRDAPQSLRARWDRTNHAGRTVTLLEGPAYALASAAGALAAGRPTAPGVVAALGAGGFGMLDDLAGDSSSKGLKGHLGALVRGEVTTGAIKIIGLATTGLVAAALADRDTRVGVGTTLIGGAAIAGAANLANLFDLRPGRALKVATLSALPLAVPCGARGAATAAAALGAAVGSLPSDLRGTSMLGDTGANAAGAMVGLALVQRSGLRGRFAVLGLTAGLTVLSEKVSFSEVIEGNALLRRLDTLGRSTS